MSEIFESQEFLNFEKLCNARKFSFVVSVTKFSSVNKPKKGPVYAMSDFFVYDIPKDWERQAIRVTPPNTWLNPKDLPQLSHPLSTLTTMPAEIKEDFVEMWNHIHGVMTRSYFCPKLYLTKIPRVEVEKFMDPALLPPGDLLSCCDLVYFPTFVDWLKSTMSEDKINGHTRIRFVALLIHLACKLYNLDPESHVKEPGTEKSQDENVRILSPSKHHTKTHETPKDNEEDIEILTPKSCNIAHTSTTQTKTMSPDKSRDCPTPDKRPPMVSIASDIVHALEDIEILTPKKSNGAISQSSTQQPSTVTRSLSVTQSHDPQSLDEVTEIEILTPSKRKTESEPKPVIDCIDLEKVVHQNASLVNDNLKCTNGEDGLNSMVFTKSSASDTSSIASSSPKVEKVEEPKPKSSLQFRRDLWGQPAELVDITDDDIVDTSVISVNTSVESDDGPVRVKSREELKSMMCGEDDSTVKLKTREELKSMYGGKDVSTENKKSDQGSEGKEELTISVINKGNGLGIKNTPSSIILGENKKDDKDLVEVLSNQNKGKGLKSETTPDPEVKEVLFGCKEVKAEKSDSKDTKSIPDKKVTNAQNKNLVSESLGKLIQVCIKLLPKKEYTLFSRKVTKYLTNLAEEHTGSVELATYIDAKCSVIKSDSKNKYVYMKDVFDEMKKFRSSAELSEKSATSKDQDHSVMAATPTSTDDKENIPEKQLDIISSETVKSDVDMIPVSKGAANITEKLPSQMLDTSAHKNDPSKQLSEKATKDLSLKDVMTSFLELCKKSLKSKVFQPYFRQILKFMNNLDPAHLNSLPLKVFIHQHSQPDEEIDTIDRIDAVIAEILQYQKSSKRTLASDEETTQQPSKKKKVGLITISSKVPPKESSLPVVKDTDCKPKEDSVISNANTNGITDDDIQTSTSEIDSTPLPVEKQMPPGDIFQSLGLRPKNVADEADSKPSIDKEAESSKQEADNMEMNEPSSSKQCFNENLVHDKDKKKAKKKVSAKHLLKLESALKKCAQQIKKLEEAEVDWDDDGDSNYILCAKYKRRYMDLFRKIAEYKKLSSSLDTKSEKKFVCDTSRYPEINKKIQKFVNRSKEFPDFQDIRKLVKEANSTLHLSNLQVDDEAENIFQAVGKKLKNRREIDESEVLVSYLKEDQMEDPASKNEELDKVLIVQAVEGKKKINQYFDDFYKTHVINAKSGDEIDSDKVKEIDERSGPSEAKEEETKDACNVTKSKEMSTVETITSLAMGTEEDTNEINPTAEVDTSASCTSVVSEVMETVDDDTKVVKEVESNGDKDTASGGETNKPEEIPMSTVSIEMVKISDSTPMDITEHNTEVIEKKA